MGRRRPRFAPFLVTGGMLGLVTGFVLSVFGPVDPRFDAASALGFLGLIFAALGALAGGVVAVLLDRRP